MTTTDKLNSDDAGLIREGATELATHNFNARNQRRIRRASRRIATLTGLRAFEVFDEIVADARRELDLD